MLIIRLFLMWATYVLRFLNYFPFQNLLRFTCTQLQTETLQLVITSSSRPSFLTLGTDTISTMAFSLLQTAACIYSRRISVSRRVSIWDTASLKRRIPSSLGPCTGVTGQTAQPLVLLSCYRKTKGWRYAVEMAHARMHLWTTLWAQTRSQELW